MTTMNNTTPKLNTENTMSMSAHSGTNKRRGMESSILKFKDVNFIVGKKDKKKNILTDVSGVVRYGRVLAGM